MYELLTLEPAIPGNDPQQILDQIQNRDPRPLRQINRAIPPDLATIVLKAMAKKWRTAIRPPQQWPTIWTKAYLWDAASRHALCTPLRHNSPIDSENEARCFQLPDLSAIMGLIPVSSRISCVAFSPDGSLLCIADTEGSATLWSMTDGKRDRVLPAPQEVVSIAFDPNGRFLALGGLGGQAQVWDLRTGDAVGQQANFPARVAGLSWIDDEPTLIVSTSNGTLFQWQPASGEPTAVLTMFEGGNSGVAVTSDWRTAVVILGTGKAQLWDVLTNRSIGPPFEHFGQTSQLAVDPRCRYVIGIDGKQQVYERQIFAPEMRAVTDLSIQAELESGVRLREDGQPRLLPVAEWELLRTSKQ